ncbi:MAG: phosphate signaling complex protein PhoU [Oscillospiraceae bacterium]|jgi:phosphate transport system protein|nr:phosphate signaling complex protein PhoU [Oscillospiraceae bacterium]
MVRSNFERGLTELHNELINMGAMVKEAIENSIKAFMASDFELCRAIIAGDKAVDDKEKQIESKCLWLIAREQPIASDLRLITTALKITTDMERIGDHASDIAELTMRIPEKNIFSENEHIHLMAKAAVEMVGDAITAYLGSDLPLAKATEVKDDAVDDYFNLIKREIAEVFATNAEKTDNAIDFLLIAKYLERIADHAVNICEWVRFSQTGEHKNTLIF